MTTTAALSELGLDRKAIAAITRKAKHRGKSTPEYVRDLIQTDLLSDQTFDQMLAPARDDFRRSGLTSRELDQLVHKARRTTVRRSRSANRNGNR